MVSMCDVNAVRVGMYVYNEDADGRFKDIHSLKEADHRLGLFLLEIVGLLVRDSAFVCKANGGCSCGEKGCCCFARRGVGRKEE
jgi:hypothetical protein